MGPCLLILQMPFFPPLFLSSFSSSLSPPPAYHSLPLSFSSCPLSSLTCLRRLLLPGAPDHLATCRGPLGREGRPPRGAVTPRRLGEGMRGAHVTSVPGLLFGLQSWMDLESTVLTTCWKGPSFVPMGTAFHHPHPHTLAPASEDNGHCDLC